MRQTRLSIGCQDWQRIIQTIGAEAAGILLYLRTMMRSMQTAEISITMRELATALRLSDETAETALASIEMAGYLSRSMDATGLITLRSAEEAAALSERRRKSAARLASRSRAWLDKLSGNSGPEIPAETPETTCKSYKTEVFMEYHAPGGNSGMKREKEPHTPQKEESLTEIQTHTRSNKTREQPELPADSLEAEYIDICGLMPKSLRDTIKAETADVREAFYLYCRIRKETEGSHWAGDRIRIAWLAARRIPAERRADSILAAAMGGWKTIRDAGSGCYFEKSTGRIVSLVRGTVEYKQQNETEKTNAELAVKLARNMRRG
jgi:hypothetical protein